MIASCEQDEQDEKDEEDSDEKQVWRQTFWPQLLRRGEQRPPTPKKS